MSAADGLGPLPKPPTFYRYQFESHYGHVWRSSSERWNGCDPVTSEGLYSADQMRAYAAEQVAAERERRSKVEAALWTAIHTLERDGDEWNVCDHLRAALKA